MVAVSGSPRSPSRSRALAEAFLDRLAADGHETVLIDLAALPAEALVARSQSPEVEAAIAEVGAADIVVAATPTYRALYTGLLKCFFDLMPQGHLAGKACVPLQTGASPVHYLAVDYGLRVLFMSLDGLPLRGVYATDAEFDEGAPNAALIARLDELVRESVRDSRLGG